MFLDPFQELLSTLPLGRSRPGRGRVSLRRRWLRRPSAHAADRSGRRCFRRWRQRCHTPDRGRTRPGSDAHELDEGIPAVPVSMSVQKDLASQLIEQLDVLGQIGDHPIGVIRRRPADLPLSRRSMKARRGVLARTHVALTGSVSRGRSARVRAWAKILPVRVKR